MGGGVRGGEGSNSIDAKSIFTAMATRACNTDDRVCAERGARRAPVGPAYCVWASKQALGKMAQPLHAQPRVDPLRLDELAEDRDVLVLLANAVGNPLTLLVAILPKVSRRCKVAAKHALATPRVDLSPFRERITTRR